MLSARSPFVSVCVCACVGVCGWVGVYVRARACVTYPVPTEMAVQMVTTHNGFWATYLPKLRNLSGQQDL